MNGVWVVLNSLAGTAMTGFGAKAMLDYFL
jgi:hypothetical protein